MSQTPEYVVSIRVYVCIRGWARGVGVENHHCRPYQTFRGNFVKRLFATWADVSDNFRPRYFLSYLTDS